MISHCFLRPSAMRLFPGLRRPHYACVLLIFLVFLTSPQAATVPEWLETLGNEESSLEARARACQRLGETGTVAAIPALAQLLDHPRLATYARTALERIPGQEASLALSKALATAEGLGKIGLIQSLAARRDQTITQELALLAASPDGGPVAVAATQALGRLGNHDAVLSLLEILAFKDRPVITATAAESLLMAVASHRREGDLALADFLVEALLLRGPALCHPAATRQRLLMSESPEPFLEAFQDTNPEIRQVAFLTVRDRPSAALGEGLQGALEKASQNRDPSEETLQHHRRLLYALRDSPAEKTGQWLAQRLPSISSVLRPDYIAVLAALGGRESLRALMDTLPDVEALEALSGMPPQEVEPVALAALQVCPEDEKARGLALMTLLERRGSLKSVPFLLERSAHRDPEIARAALRSLRPSVNLEHLPALLALYDRSGEGTRQAIFAALVDACRRSEPQEAAAQMLLARYRDAGSIEERSPWIRILVDLAYEPALPTLVEGLGSLEAATVEATIRHLGRWPSAAPVSSLIPICRQAPHSQLALRAVLSLLAREKDPSQRAPHLEAVASFIASQAEKRAYVALLGRTPSPASLRLLEPLLEDEHCRAEATEARDRIRSALETP